MYVLTISCILPSYPCGLQVREYELKKADRIVSFDCDFASTDPQGPVTPFFDRRKPEGKAYDAKPLAASPLRQNEIGTGALFGRAISGVQRELSRPRPYPQRL